VHDIGAGGVGRGDEPHEVDAEELSVAVDVHDQVGF
jgi:hypothetical protein